MKNYTSEQDFLERYDSGKYAPISVTVDIVVLGVVSSESENYRKLNHQKLNVLLINRNDFPFKGSYALPGGFVQGDESIEETVQRVLKSKTGIDNIYYEQLYTFGDVNRDPRMRIISCSYIALVDIEKTSLSNAVWMDLQNANACSLAFDHNHILTEALNRLRGKINYTDIVFHMLPEKFTISQLQSVYEILLEEKLIPAAFRRTMANKIQETDEFKTKAGHRPSRFFVKKNSTYRP